MQKLFFILAVSIALPMALRAQGNCFISSPRYLMLTMPWNPTSTKRRWKFITTGITVLITIIS
ncbi:MAG: hypothetical protein U0Z17_09320 [Bacteroidales bacterium]